MSHALVETIRELAAEKPDNVYNKPFEETTCYYTRGICTDLSEGCIVGQALCRMGFKNEMVNIDNNFGGNAYTVINILGLELTLAEKEWVNEVQSHQDKRETWGNAVKLAEPILMES